MSLKGFEFLEKVGEGAYSTVWRVRRNSDKHIYALKKVRMSKLKEKEKRNSLNEVRFLASVNHPNVISYKEAFFDDDTGSLCIVMEFAADGDLYQKIQEHQKTRRYMSEAFLWKLLLSVVKGLKALHDLNIMHRDLKSANVFLTGDMIKLGDMNVSKVAAEGMLHTQTGTPYYASPEVWRDAPYDTKSDIWSLGCVLYEAAALKAPFRADDMNGLFKKVVRGEYPPLPRVFSKEFQGVVAQMLQVNSSSRPSCDQLLAMRAVASKDFSTTSSPTPNYLMETIVFPKNIAMITARLPKPKYREASLSPASSYATSSFRHRHNASEIKEPRRRDGRDARGGADSVEPQSHHRIMREQYGALRLPRLKPLENEKVKSLPPKASQLLRAQRHEGYQLSRRGLAYPAWWG